MDRVGRWVEIARTGELPSGATRAAHYLHVGGLGALADALLEIGRASCRERVFVGV